MRAVLGNDFWGLPLSDPESHKSYRPLTVLSFRLNHHLHGLWSPGFHIVNIAAHGAVSLLFLWSCLGFGVPLQPSLTAGLAFAAHPIHTEAVRSFLPAPDVLCTGATFFCSGCQYSGSFRNAFCGIFSPGAPGSSKSHQNRERPPDSISTLGWFHRHPVISSSPLQGTGCNCTRPVPRV